jgi:hypothetical protein
MATDYNARFNVNNAQKFKDLEDAVNGMAAIAEKEKSLIGPLTTSKQMWTSSGEGTTQAASDLRRNWADLHQSWRSPADSGVFASRVDRSTASLTDAGNRMSGSSGVTTQLQRMTDFIRGTGVQVDDAKTKSLAMIARARAMVAALAATEGAGGSAADIEAQYVTQIIPYVLPMGTALQQLGAEYEQVGPQIVAEAQGLKWDGPGTNSASGAGTGSGGAQAGGGSGSSQAGAGSGGGDAGAGGGDAGAGGAGEAGAGGAGGDQAGAGQAGDPGQTGQPEVPALPTSPGGTGLAGLPTLPPPTLPTMPSHVGIYPTQPPNLPPLPGGLPVGSIGPAGGLKGKLPPLGAIGGGPGGGGGVGGGGLGKGRLDLPKLGTDLRTDLPIARAGEQSTAPAQPAVGRPPAAPTGIGGTQSGTTAAGSGGTPPPMMPPGAAGVGGGGRGGKPGAGAIRPVNRKRKSQDDETPGVPIGLRGKAGKSLPGGFPMVPAASRRRKDEREKADTIQLLDEELWQVEEAEAAETKKRVGRLAT